MTSNMGFKQIFTNFLHPCLGKSMEWKHRGVRLRQGKQIRSEGYQFNPHRTELHFSSGNEGSSSTSIFFNGNRGLSLPIPLESG